MNTTDTNDIRRRSLGHRAPVLWLLIPTIAGYCITRALPAGWGSLGWGAVSAAGLLVAAWKNGDASHRFRWATGLIVAVAATACLYFQLREHRLAVWDRLPPREVELTLDVESVFPASPLRTSTTGLARIAGSPTVVSETVGQKIYFSVQAPENHPVLASSRIRACGVLAPLARRPNPGFDSYLANSGAAFKFTRGRWLAEERGATRYRIFCANASARFERILGLGLDDRPDLRSVHVAMLLGTMAELSAEQRKLFMNSGTMHLFAISGLHIAVIWAVLAALLAAARIPRVPAIVAGLVLLLLYVEITGGAPSAMRSWMMIAFVLAGQALRWARNPLAGIAGSALLAIWWNPWQLFGLGFQMSYAIVAALLLYGLPLDELWQRRWRPWRDLPPGNLGWWRTGFVEAGRAGISAVALAVAATLISVPMTLANFGLLTPGSMLVNLVCIPASSLSIIAGIGSIIAGLAGLAPLSVLLNHASALIILSMERGLDLAMQVPGMYWPAQFKVEWMGDALLVVLLALMLAGYALRWRRNVGGMWPPVVVVLLALAVLVHHGPPEQPAAAHLPDAIPPATSANR